MSPLLKETKIELEKVIRVIYRIVQSCPEVRNSKPIKEEADRLDKCVQEVSDFCDNFLSDLKNK
jgi:hypothetical protein